MTMMTMMSLMTNLRSTNRLIVLILLIASHIVVGYSSFSYHTPLAAPPSPRTSDTLTIAMTGDIMMGTTWPDTLLPYADGAYLFRDTKTLLRRADLTVGNLEGTLAYGGESTKDGPNQYAFRTPPHYAGWLADAGYDFMSMANNHANDFGIEGIEETERALDSCGIKYAGLEGRTETAVIERKGLRIGLCAFGHNPYTLRHTEKELKTVGRIIDDLVRQTDIVVVSIHGGAEGGKYSHLPDSMETFFTEKRGHLRHLAHFCIDHGADVVYGHGPHVVRAVESYRGRFIAYSLGNFCTPYRVSLKGVSGYAPLIEIKIDSQGRFLKGQIYSFIQQYGRGPRWSKKKPNAVAQRIKWLTEADIPDSHIRIDSKGTLNVETTKN